MLISIINIVFQKFNDNDKFEKRSVKFKISRRSCFDYSELVDHFADFLYNIFSCYGGNMHLPGCDNAFSVYCSNFPTANLQDMRRLVFPLAFFLMLVFTGISPIKIVTLAVGPDFFVEIDKDGILTVKEGQKPLWKYNSKFQKHPQVTERDPRNMAACYIHPLYGIDGEILTDDAPKDHFHHHGVFWTWPHVKVFRAEGTVEKYDVWTGNTRMKQLFVRYGDTEIHSEKTVVKIENGWFIAPKINEYEWDENGKPVSEKVVSENVTITTWRICEEDGVRSRAVDFDFTWKVGEFPISLQGAGGKSYGGLTIRFKPSTDKPGGDSVITTPEGIAKEDLPEKPLAWADYTSIFRLDENGKPAGKPSGGAIFVSPDHPNFPPTWLVRYYGPLCLGWPGVEERKFAAGEEIKLSYRIWIHDTSVEKKAIQKAYDKYAAERSKTEK